MQHIVTFVFVFVFVEQRNSTATKNDSLDQLLRILHWSAAYILMNVDKGAAHRNIYSKLTIKTILGAAHRNIHMTTPP